MAELGKLIIVFGVIAVIVGVIIMLAGRIPFLGRLPGDFTFSSGGFSCFFPLATSILLSIILTIILNVVLRIFNR